MGTKPIVPKDLLPSFSFIHSLIHFVIHSGHFDIASSPRKVNEVERLSDRKVEWTEVTERESTFQREVTIEAKY